MWIEVLAAEGAKVGDGAVYEGGAEVATFDWVVGWFIGDLLVMGADQRPEVCGESAVFGDDEEVIDDLFTWVRYVSDLLEWAGICIFLSPDNGKK